MNFGTKNLLKEIIKHKPIKNNSIEKPKKKEKNFKKLKPIYIINNNNY